MISDPEFALYSAPLPIAAEKKHDLLQLIAYLPPGKRQFYESLEIKQQVLKNGSAVEFCDGPMPEWQRGIINTYDKHVVRVNKRIPVQPCCVICVFTVALRAVLTTSLIYATARGQPSVYQRIACGARVG